MCGHILGLNVDVAAEIAKDKVATYQVLAAAGVGAIAHYLLSTVINPEIDRCLLERLLKEHTELVIKPLKGSGGQLVGHFHDTDSILMYAAQANEREWAASPFVDIARELRLIVFDGKVCMAYEELRPAVTNGLKFFNLSSDGDVRALEPASLRQDIISLAERSLQAVGLRFGAVDVVIDTRGAAQVLEVNSRPALGHFAERSAVNKELVLDFYELVIGSLFGLC